MMAHLVGVIDHYGPAIEADLFERGWDILDYFRGVRPWPQLLRLMDTALAVHGTHYSAALLSDPELAERFLARENGKRSSLSSPPLVGYDRVASKLDDILDTLRAQSRAEPVPRPVTALEQARSQRSYARHLALVAEVLG